MTTPQETTPQDRIDKYVKLRDYKKEADGEFKKSMERVNQALTKLEGELAKDLEASGGTSLTGANGTVYFTTRSTASVKDRDEFLRFVFETRNLELLDVRANKKIVRELGAEGTVVPGVTYTEIKQVGVRRGKES
jgi:hypothetical protein